MRKLLVSVMILSVGLLWGCGGDDGGTDGGGGTTTPRLLVNTTAATPTMSSPNETTWNSVDSVMVAVSAANTPKIDPSAKVTSLATEVKVQAIAKNDTLYVRLRWADNTMNAWPDFWYVTDTFPVTFTRDLIEQEDQAYVMFDGAPGGGYDCWGWKVLRTGGAGVGMGYRYNNNALTSDAAGLVNLPVATSNSQQRLARDTSEFIGYVLTIANSVARNDSMRTDTVIVDVGQPPVPETTVTIVSYGQSHGWSMAQKLPGYLIDSSILNPARTDADRGSILDIRTADNFAGGGYSLVMTRKMNTGFADDLNLAALDSVKVVVALFDNQNSFTTGGTHRGFSAPFWLVF